MDFLVGNTGFVGSNLADRHKFDGLFNSKNISSAFGGNPERLIYAGVRAEMYLANKNPEEDLNNIKIALDNMKKINPKKIILISTISVYNNPSSVDEETNIDEKELTSYGRNRYYLEQQVQENFDDYLIIRLPALYGINLKKNFIFDFINVIPMMLTEEKYEELRNLDSFLKEFYFRQDNGFYKCSNLLNDLEKNNLKDYFRKVKFSALNFTDSRSIYQFYNLKYLWNHIEKAVCNKLAKVNITTEPVSISELYFSLTGENFINELNKKPFDYNLKSRYSEIFGGEKGYFFNKEFVMKDIKDYIGEALKYRG